MDRRDRSEPDTDAPREEPTIPSSAPHVESEPSGPRYERISKLGAGGMGVVHLCRDARMRRYIAMKTASESHRLDPEARALLEREAHIQGRLEHPAIVPVHDVGTLPGGATFFTMRRIEGTSLRAVLNGLRKEDPKFVESYGRRRLLAAFSTVCAAVAFAHTQGVLHRDIKPGNVMLGEYGEVYLLDFGVAHSELDEAVAEKGSIIGTIGYIAPEQAAGEAIDERADVYSLGALLFELLTLEPLHARDNSLVSTMNGADARASVRAPKRDVPPELEALCVHATAQVPSDRIESARAIREAIERFLDGDRDLERRRALAEEHAVRARKAVMSALRGRANASLRRDDAIDEANRALALDPSNPTALHVIAAVVLLTDPEREAERAQREATEGARRALARVGLTLFAPWLLGMTFVLLLGLRSIAVAVAAVGCTIAATVCIWMRTRNDTMTVRIAAVVATHAALMFAASVFGPFLLLPGCLACLAVAFSVATFPPSHDDVDPRNLRLGALAFSALALLSIVALEAFGVLPPSMEFRDNTIVLLPRVADFPPRATFFFLVVTNVLLVVAPALIVVRVRDLSLERERQTFEMVSRLRQLVPRQTRSAADSTTTHISR